MENEPTTTTSETRHFALPAGLMPGISRLSGRMLPLVAVFVSLGVFAPGYLSAAINIEKGVILISGWVAHLIVSFLGQLLLVLVGALIWVAQYNGFIDSPAVVNGWSIVRDVANMFFIVVLLVIAFGTIIGYGSYDYKQNLPTLLIMAVLVNFSRTICGLIIDFAQVVMLTFVHGFDQAAGGNFTQAFGITNLLQLRTDAPTDNADFSIVISFFLAVILAGISVGVIIVMLAVLVVRIVMIWLLVVMSPLAFLAKSAPFSAGKGMYATWWKDFTSNVIVGPFMAFFLWLSLISVAGGAIATQGFPDEESTGESFSGGSSQAFTDTSIQQFIISIALLLGGTQMSLKMGGMAGSAGGFAQGVVKGAAKGAARGAWRTGVGTGRIAGRTGLRVAGALGGDRLVDETRQRVLSGASKLPLVGNTAAKALAKQNAARARMEKTEGAYLKNLDPNTQESILNRYMGRGMSALMSPKDLAGKKAALRTVLGNIADGKASDGAKSKYHKYRAELEKMAGADPDIKKELGKIDKKVPSLMIDPNADPQTQAKQLEAYKKTVGGLGQKEVAGLMATEITPDFVAAFGKGRAEKMVKDGKAPKAVIDALAAALKGSSSFAHLSAADKADHVKNISAEDAKRLPAAAIDAETAKAMSAEGFNAIANDLGKMNISASDISNKDNAALAEQFVKAMEAGAISRLPNEMKTALAGAVAEKDAAGAVAITKKMDEVFKSFDSKSGNFTDSGDRNRFAAAMGQAGSAKKVAESVSTSQIGAKGGVSEMGIEMIANITSDDVKEMYDSGNDAQAAAVLRAAKRMADMGKDKLGSAATKANAYASDATIEKAAKNAEKLILEAAKKIAPQRLESNIRDASRKAIKAEAENAARTARTNQRRQSRHS